jgi:hypothetical protein
MSSAGLGRTLRTLRDPLLLFVVPVVFALLLAFVGYGNSWPIGFDFRGTLWEPARALLDGVPIYPKPTREAVLVGNPAVYPPVFILASVPLALLPVTAAAWLWLCALGVAMFGSMWVLGIRDWRCLVLAVTSPVVVHGLWYGNLTVLLVLPIALAWGYRDRARVAGIAVGVAVAAKLFVWPLVVWLLLTRRFRAAAWAAGSAVLLMLGAWALVGFQGLRDYPSLLRAVQDVYAVRSLSVSTVAGALGASVSAAVAVAAVAGLACLALAVWLVRQPDGDRRAFAIVVAACILASPIVELRRAPVRPDRGHLAPPRSGVVLRLRRVAHLRLRGGRHARCGIAAAGSARTGVAFQSRGVVTVVRKRHDHRRGARRHRNGAVQNARPRKLIDGRARRVRRPMTARRGATGRLARTHSTSAPWRRLGSCR